MADEILPHLDGERDEEVALAQWQRKRIAELEQKVADVVGQLQATIFVRNDVLAKLAAMHRRAQKAESIANAKLDSLAANGVRSFGRALANYAASRYLRERDDAREALRHAEEQLETERQRNERLMAERDACAQLADDRLRMLDVATAKVVDLDAATDRALALSEENARLKAEIAELKCPDCAGSGRVWVGEDKDRPAMCFACDGRGRR